MPPNVWHSTGHGKNDSRREIGDAKSTTQDRKGPPRPGPMKAVEDKPGFIGLINTEGKLEALKGERR